jgi:hypothetical protein
MTSIYIDLVVEYEKVKEFYGLEKKRIYNIERIKNKQVAFVLTPFEYEGEYDAYIESQKLGEYVFEMYDHIPDQLKLKESRRYGSVKDYYKGLKVDDFIFV